MADAPPDEAAEPTRPQRMAPRLEEVLETEENEAPSTPPVTRLRQALISSADEQPVQRAEVLRGYEVEPDRYVTFERDELKTLQRKTSANMEIVRSVRLSEIDPVFFETSYYLAPNRSGEKAYAILFEALRASQHVALARVGMYGREHVVILRPGAHGILAHTMFYTDEIRSENEFRADVESVAPKELAMARVFLETIQAPFAPEEFKDTYREALQARITAKASAADISPASQKPVASTPVVDIFEALKKSVDMARKRSAPEFQPARKAPGRVTEIKTRRPSRKSR